VKGIGAKFAAKLVSAHGSVEEMLKGLEKVEERMRAKLEADRDSAVLSKDLATIRTDAPVKFDPDAFLPRDPDPEKAGALFRELEFTGLLGLVQDEAEKRQAFALDKYRTILSEEDLKKYLAKAKKKKTLSVDLETDSLDPMRANIVGVAMAAKPGEAVYVPVGHRYLGAPKQIALKKVLSLLKPVLEADRPEKVGQNIKYDALILRRNGITVRPIGCDTMVAAYLVNPDKGPFGLERLAREYLVHDAVTYEDVVGKGKKQITFDEVDVARATEYAGEDADVVARLVPILRGKIAEAGMEKLWEDVERPLLDVLLEMEQCGVRLDAGELEKISGDFQARMRKLMKEIFTIAGREFNIDSPKQLQEVLFRDLGLKATKKTKTGYSTDVSVLEKLAHEHPLPARILDYRSISKLKGTYADALPKLIHPETGRIHTSYNQAVAATGRLSSSDPNLQNIPVRTEEGRRIRNAFVAEKGRRFISADYSQIELRVMAHLSEDAAFVRAFREDRDVHTATAAEIFGVAPGGVDADMRRKAKEINFGIIYGMGAFGLGQRLGISQQEARTYIDTYFERYKGVRKYIDKDLERARKRGYVATVLGRRRYVPELASKNRMRQSATERIAINAPIQGSAADIMKIAMVRVRERLLREKRKARTILQVHDELVVEAPKAEVAKVRDALREEMEGAYSMKVPLKVDVTEGDRWSDLK
jgi:DNA polymerase-1